MTFPASFETARLVAHRLDASHYDDLRRLQTNPGYMAELGGVRDDEQTRAYLATNLDHWARDGFGLWMLTEKGSDLPIGVAVLRRLDLDGVDEVETGYGFLPEFWGRGFATEIASACLHFGFETLGLSTIVAVTTPGHRKSQHVLLKLGFGYERDVDLRSGPGLSLIHI